MRDIQTECFDDAAAVLGKPLSERLLSLPRTIKRDALEIRLRSGAPLAVTLPEGQAFPFGMEPLEQSVLQTVFVALCGHAVYSHEDDIRRGCITVGRGHRAGICGMAVTENGDMRTVSHITSINLRIAKEIIGCADGFISSIIGKGGTAESTLIAGPPCSGKTTILRDIILALSEGRCVDGKRIKRHRVAVIDERGELAATADGQPQCFLGSCSDVYDGYPRNEGIMQALRYMSPEVIVCDEIGTPGDAEAVMQCEGAGVSFIASVHCGCVAELTQRTCMQELLKTGVFKKIVILDAAPKGSTREVLNAEYLFGQQERNAV